MNQITAPFTASQVNKLNQFQVGVNSVFPSHSFTCINRSDSNDNAPTHGTEGGDRGLLIATESGWVCPHCGHTQEWAHEFMTREKITEDLDAFMRLDTKQILLERTEKAIADYLRLYMSRELTIAQSFDENDKSERIWKTVAVMLTSLRQRRMELLGVTIVDKRIIAVDDTWTDLTKSKPEDGVSVLMLIHDSQVLNPAHDGYGCNVWTGVRALSHGGHFLSTGGMATHWKQVPAPLLHQ